ncbi:MAG TPA: hypothetical protein VEK38_00835 [Candidatus Bathyarchaeia archaeon]|nr:hypothetical protein [Candidatus Bathyarchaeia archaeon]
MMWNVRLLAFSALVFSNTYHFSCYCMKKMDVEDLLEQITQYDGIPGIGIPMEIVSPVLAYKEARRKEQEKKEAEENKVKNQSSGVAWTSMLENSKSDVPLPIPSSALHDPRAVSSSGSKIWANKDNRPYPRLRSSDPER